MNRSFIFACVAALLFVLAAVGLVREMRAASLGGAFIEDIHGEGDERLKVATQKVHERFMEIRSEGPRGKVWPAPFRTAADFLLIGGDCGAASFSLASLLDIWGYPFRIVQLNVGANGASHIMVEARAANGRYVLLDPLAGRVFESAGKMMSLEEIRSQGEAGILKDLPERYSKQWSLLGPYRRTNWDRFPLNLFKGLISEERKKATSLRAWTIEAGGEVALGFSLAGFFFVVLSMRARRSRKLSTESGTGLKERWRECAE